MSTLNNCIVYFNTATMDGPNHRGGSLNYCCTTPEPWQSVGNITNAPLFVNQAGGNLRLQSNSPCINAGNNAYAAGPTDLDGLPRIVSGTVDIGAYEFQGPGSVISYAWLQHYGLPTDGSADSTDPDADGHNNWQEWRCGTEPHQRALGVAPADGIARRHQRDRELAERGRRELFPGAEHGPVGVAAVDTAGHRHSRPARHDDLHGHQRRSLVSVVLPCGRGELNHEKSPA